MSDHPSGHRGGNKDDELRFFDAALIRALQEDGRASIHDLAAQLGASRDVVSARLRTLTDNGGLRIVAAVDPGFAGHQVLIHAMVDLEGAAGPVAAQLSGLSETVFVSKVSGAHPLVFESRHGNLDELHELLESIRAIPAVRKIRVTTYAEVLKGFFVARLRKQFSLDEIDYDLIAILQRDGRTSFTALSAAVHLSPSSVRERVGKLIDAGVIRISAIHPGGVSRNRFSLGVGIAARGDTRAIRTHILKSTAIDFAAQTHGSYDFIATVVGATSTEVLDVVEGLRELDEVESLDSWTHLDLVKEDYARALGHVVGD